LDEQLYSFWHETRTRAARPLLGGFIELKTDADGLRYVKFSTQRQTKTRTGENPENVRESKPKMLENRDNPQRCPVTTYLALI